MPDLPTTAKGAATSRRILDAAAEEFAERGIAGARIDRIAVAARANKAQLYSYFGNKDALFDAVMADCIARGTTEAEFDADDLAGWALAVYEQNRRSPHLARLLAWVRLERSRPGLSVAGVDLEPKLAAVARAQAAGRLRAGNPADLLLMVLGMASAWSPAGVFVADPGEPEADHEQRRALLRESVDRAVRPS